MPHKSLSFIFFISSDFSRKIYYVLDHLISYNYYKFESRISKDLIMETMPMQIVLLLLVHLRLHVNGGI
jgi:hypothetical protein